MLLLLSPIVVFVKDGKPPWLWLNAVKMEKSLKGWSALQLLLNTKSRTSTESTRLRQKTQITCTAEQVMDMVFHVLYKGLILMRNTLGSGQRGGADPEQHSVKQTQSVPLTRATRWEPRVLWLLTWAPAGEIQDYLVSPSSLWATPAGPWVKKTVWTWNPPTPQHFSSVWPPGRKWGVQMDTVAACYCNLLHADDVHNVLTIHADLLVSAVVVATMQLFPSNARIYLSPFSPCTCRSESVLQGPAWITVERTYLVLQDA